MPVMPRPNSKATKLAYKILGEPSNQINSKSALRKPRSTPGYGFTYGHKLTDTILR